MKKKLAEGKNDMSIMNSSLVSGISNMPDQQINSSRVSEGQSMDPKYTEQKKVENLKTLLDIDNQLFLLGLCNGVKDPKQKKKITNATELESIRQEKIQMVILAL